MNSAAPVPSPRRSERSRYGSSPRCSRITAWPGSAERCEAKSAWRASGASVTATSAAAPEMKPSRTTGTRRAAPARITPTSPAISKPPTLARTSRPSRPLGAFTASARRTTSTLRASVASSTPVPRPVTRAGAAPVIAAAIALAAVVLPIPISPVARRSAPASSACSASRAPVSSACRACACVIAGPRARLAVPGAIAQATSSGELPIGLATPKSATTTRAPAWRARTFTAAPPRRKFSTICAVTIWGYALTPSATTPWSAAKVKMWGRSTRGAPPASPARRAASSSSRPRLPGGFVRLSRWRCPSASPPAGGAVIALRSLASIPGPRGPRRRDGLERERHAGHHQHDAVARGGDPLVDEAEEVAEAEPHRGLGVHALAHLVGDDREGRRAAADQLGKRLGLVEDRVVRVAAQEAIRDPERQAVHDDRIEGVLEPGEVPDEIVRLLDGLPVAGTLGPVARDPARHVVVGGARRRDEGDAPGARGIRDGEAALTAARAPEDEKRRRHAPGPPSKTGVLVRARAGLLALGSSYSPRLPGLAASGSPAGFVPDYSDGVAAAFNRLPGARTTRRR